MAAVVLLIHRLNFHLSYNYHTRVKELLVGQLFMLAAKICPCAICLGTLKFIDRVQNLSLTGDFLHAIPKYPCSYNLIVGWLFIAHAVLFL